MRLWQEIARSTLGPATNGDNLISLPHYQTRLALYARSPDAPPNGHAPAFETAQSQIKRPAEQLRRYLVFTGETPLDGLDAHKVIAGSAFDA